MVYLYAETSWETLITGMIKFKADLSLNEREYIIERVRESLELQPTEYGFFDEKIEGGGYFFKHLNWCSHVDEGAVERLVEELKGKVESYEVCLYYLNNGVSYYKHGDEEGKYYIVP